MKEKIKVICKKLKNKLPLLLACLLVGAMVFGLYVFSQSKQVNTLSASAEEASTVAETADVESGIDLTQYPSANLIDVSKMVNTNFTVDEDGVYTMTRNAGDARFSGTYVFPKQLPAGTYTFSCEFVSYNSNYNAWLQAVVKTSSETLIVFWYNSSSASATTKRTMTFSSPLVSIKFYAEGTDPVGTVSKFKNFMMNAGDTAYPYIPNFDNVYNNGYNAGYDVGETDGKEIGYSDGLDKARAGYWNDSKVYVNLKGTSNGATVNSYLEIAPTITSNGVDLSNVYTEINAKYPNFITTDTTFGFEFVSPVYFDGLNIRCIGDTSVLVDREMIAIVYDPKTKKESGVDCRFILIDGSDNVAGFETATMREELFGKQLKLFGTFTVQNISQFKNMRFYSNEVIANLNYQAGYQAGVLDNTLYQKGYDKGFELGEKKGFDEGVIKGQTNDPYDLGDFLFSIIDAPFRVIREALNFEILGFNVSEILFFIITISLFAFVLKYIRGA